MNPITYMIDTLMIPFLKFSYTSITPNYGIAIIILTVIIKIIFIPLTQKQYASMKAMKKLAPELKKIKEKHKKEPQKVQKAMMALYKQHNINPFSGCLPGIIQIPFFIAIFYTVHSDSFKALLAEPNINTGLFSFWLSNLSLPDTTYILPIALGLVTFWSQKLTAGDPMQQKMMMFMPVILFVMCLKMPSGVVLYWVTSTLFTAIQQTISLKTSQEDPKLIAIERKKA